MAKQPYYPPEVSVLLVVGTHLLQSLSADFVGFTDPEDVDKEWGDF